MESEKVLISWLESQGYPTFGVRPKNAPKEYLTVERTGGAVRNGIDDAQFALGCWAETNAKAATLAADIEALLPDFADEPYATQCEVNSHYRYPPGDGSGYRYQLTVDASIYV